MMIVPTGHALIVDQSINDGFLGCLNSRGENWIHQIVRNCFNRMRKLLGLRSAGIGSGKCDEQIAGAVSGNAARPREPE